MRPGGEREPSHTPNSYCIPQLLPAHLGTWLVLNVPSTPTPSVGAHFTEEETGSDRAVTAALGAGSPCPSDLPSSSRPSRSPTHLLYPKPLASPSHRGSLYMPRSVLGPVSQEVGRGQEVKQADRHGEQFYEHPTTQVIYRPEIPDRAHV